MTSVVCVERSSFADLRSALIPCCISGTILARTRSACPRIQSGTLGRGCGGCRVRKWFNRGPGAPSEAAHWRALHRADPWCRGGQAIGRERQRSMLSRSGQAATSCATGTETGASAKHAGLRLALDAPLEADAEAQDLGVRAHPHPATGTSRRSAGGVVRPLEPQTATERQGCPGLTGGRPVGGQHDEGRARAEVQVRREGPQGDADASATCPNLGLWRICHRDRI